MTSFRNELLLKVAVWLGEYGQDEGSRLIGLESRGDNDVLARDQSEELHDFSSIHVVFGWSHRVPHEELCR